MKIDSKWLTILAGSSLLISQAAWTADEESTTDVTTEPTEETDMESGQSQYQHRVNNQVRIRAENHRGELDDPDSSSFMAQQQQSQQSAFGGTGDAGTGGGSGSGGGSGGAGGGVR